MDKFIDALKRTGKARVDFGDRQYEMDQHGTLRRLTPVPLAGVLNYGPHAKQT